MKLKHDHVQDIQRESLPRFHLQDLSCFSRRYMCLIYCLCLCYLLYTMHTWHMSHVFFAEYQHESTIIKDFLQTTNYQMVDINKHIPPKEPSHQTHPTRSFENKSSSSKTCFKEKWDILYMIFFFSRRVIFSCHPLRFPASSTWDAPGIKFACSPSLRGFCPRQCAPAASWGAKDTSNLPGIQQLTNLAPGTCFFGGVGGTTCTAQSLRISCWGWEVHTGFTPGIFRFHACDNKNIVLQSCKEP